MSSPGASPILGRKLLLVAVIAALVGGLFVLSFGYADHSPSPHHITVAVVAPPRAVSAVAHGLTATAPGAFDVVASPSTSAARRALHHQQIRGALVLPGGGSHSAAAQVLTVSAAGTALEQVVAGALGGVAEHVTGRPAQVTDVVPLPAGDRAGTMAYLLGIGMLLPSVLGSSALYLVGVRSRIWWRVAAAVLFAVLVGGLGMVVSVPLLGALHGPWLSIWGILTLGALSFVLCVGAAQATFGLPATGLMALAFIFVGNGIAGGSVPTGMLPDVYRQISPLTPNSGIVHGVRAVVYFGGHGVGSPLLVLALWTAAALWVLVAVDLLHSAAAAKVAPDQRGDVYATPGAVHARRLVSGTDAPAPASASGSTQ